MRALDGRLPRKRTNVSEYLHALQVHLTGSYVESIDTANQAKKERGHVNCGRVYRDKKEWRQDPDPEHTP